jgi:hypothetical protein
MKLFVSIVLFAALAFAQSPVNVSQGVAPAAIEKQYFYDGSNNLQYVCMSPQNGKRTTVQRTDSSLTNIVDSSNTATITTAADHGLYIGARVTISGATVDTDLNGTYTVLTVPSSTTYTVTTANVTDATYTEATLVIATSNPLLTQAIWAIQIFTYNVGNYLTGSYLANAGAGYALACTNRASY